MKHLKKIDEHFYPYSNELSAKDSDSGQGESDMKGVAMNFLGEVQNIKPYSKPSDMDEAYNILNSIFKKYMAYPAFQDYLDSLS